MKYSKYILVLLIAFAQKAHCQTASDTAALVKEFTGVMAFTSQPYLYYTTLTKAEAVPLLNARDTIGAKGVFYKNNGNMYCNTTRDEMYVEDSLQVVINNEHKTIWISKANASVVGGMNPVPAVTKKMMEIVKRNYIISKSTSTDGDAVIRFETRKSVQSKSTTSAAVLLEYREQTRLPKSIVIEMSMKQPADDEMITAIKNEGVDETKLLQLIDGVNYIVTTQRVSVLFTNIDNSKEKVMQIPSFKEKLSLDTNTGLYTGKGAYRDYEVTKTF